MTYTQNTAEWLEMRRSHIGASDAPVIMQVSPYKTVHQLWEEKLGLSQGEADNANKRYGREMEETARQAYEKLTGTVMIPDVVFLDGTVLMASLDGVNLDRSRAVEIKNANEADHALAEQGKIPDKYYPQLQHQMMVLGIDSMDYFSYRDGRTALVNVLADQEYIKNLREEEGKFWDLVKNKIEPELTERDIVTNSSDEWTKAAREWTEVNEQIKALSAREKELRAKLIALADDKSTRGGGITVTKSTRKGAVDYTSIPELFGVDLEQYRKGVSIVWKIS